MKCRKLRKFALSKIKVRNVSQYERLRLASVTPQKKTAPACIVAKTGAVHHGQRLQSHSNRNPTFGRWFNASMIRSNRSFGPLVVASPYIRRYLARGKRLSQPMDTICRRHRIAQKHHSQASHRTKFFQPTICNLRASKP